MRTPLITKNKYLIEITHKRSDGHELKTKNYFETYSEFLAIKKALAKYKNLTIYKIEIIQKIPPVKKIIEKHKNKKSKMQIAKFLLKINNQ